MKDKINIDKQMAAYDGDHTKADLALHEWRALHEDTYQDFLDGIKAVEKGDIALLEKMFTAMKACVPHEAFTYYYGIIDWMHGKKGSDKFINELFKDADIDNVTEETAEQLWARMPQSLQAIANSWANDLVRGELRDLANDRHGLAVFLMYLIHAVIESHVKYSTAIIANMGKRAVEGKDNLLRCMYCYVMFDKGLSQMAPIIDRLLTLPNVDTDDLTLAKIGISTLVTCSTGMGVENKSGWETIADKSSPEVWKEISFALRSVKYTRGKKRKIVSLQELCNAKVIKKIDKFLKENTTAISLSYLLFSLSKAGKINPGIKYMVFHHAIEQYTGKSFNYKIPQQRYGELKQLSLNGRQHSDSWKAAKKIVDRWTLVFSSC